MGPLTPVLTRISLIAHGFSSHQAVRTGLIRPLYKYILTNTTVSKRFDPSSPPLSRVQLQAGSLSAELLSPRLL